MRWRVKIIYPFCAIVGQEKMKMTLILNVINPKIWEVLLRCEKETGKSLGVRALAHLLPEINVVTDCPFHCDLARSKEMYDFCSAKLANGEKRAQFIVFGLIKHIYDEMKGRYLRLEELSAPPIGSAVRDKLFHDPGIIIN